MLSITTNSGPASISMSYSFAWNVEEYISVSKTFQWHVGEGPLFWYLVESYPIDDCDIHPTCKEQGKSQCLSLSVLASSVCDLCTRLKEQYWTHKVRKAYKWSRPALECDVLAGKKLGIDYSCNTLEDVTDDFIKCVDCYEFVMPLCDGSRTYNFYHNCISYSEYDDFPCVWYSEYLHIDPIVTLGQKLGWGEKIGTIADTSAFDPHLHWGVGDGCGGGIGQTIDFDGYFGDIPIAGARNPSAPGPGVLKLSPIQVDFIKSSTMLPLDRYYCEWAQYYASPFHGGVEYYAQDLACSSPTDVNEFISLLPKTIGGNVYNTCGSNGSYIESEVVHIADVDPGNPSTKGRLVYVRHTKVTKCINLPPVYYTPVSLRSMGKNCYCEGPNSGNCDVMFRGVINDITKIPSIVKFTKPGFNMNDIKMMTPQVDSIITKCGILPSNLKLKHNLAKAHHLKEFLARNKLKLQDEVDLVYSKASNSWQHVAHLNGHNEKWTIVFSWVCSNDGDAGNFGWKSDIHINTTFHSRKQNTRILSTFASHGMLDGKNLFGVNFNYNTSTNKVTARQPVIVKNKTMVDEIGMFAGGDWVKDPYLTINVSVDKKG